MVDLARSACVCRLWSSVASHREIQVNAFKAPWKPKSVIGNPTSGCFCRDNRLSRFAISHRLARGDTVASLAVKYSVQVMDIKRLNNMMSDHGIHSRDRLLIPVSSPTLLINGTCYIELEAHAKSEVAVLCTWEEMVNDAVDSALDSDDIEDEIDEEVDKVLTSLAGETAAQLPEAATHVAAQYGHTAYIYHIVTKWNADPDIPDNEGRSPLHWYLNLLIIAIFCLMFAFDYLFYVKDKFIDLFSP
ncbi:hypothetical protein LXL04_023843 [Taraxacum kok-saghyz]